MLVNLTPHPINLYGSRTLEEGPSEVVDPSGIVARIAVVELGTSLSANSRRVIEFVQYGQIHDLPRPMTGTDYIVSLVVALAARGRNDLLAPYIEVRNEKGTMVGCRYLQRIC